MASNLRDIKAYDEQLYDEILQLIASRNRALYELVKQDLLPLRVWGFPVTPRKLKINRGQGESTYVTSFIVSIDKRKNGKRVVNSQVYLGQNKLDILEIKKKIYKYLVARPDVVRGLELSPDTLEQYRKEVSQ